MTDIGFYHLTRSGLEQALPQLLAKTMQAGKRALIVLGSDQRLTAIDDLLWTFDKPSWLPHGRSKADHPEDHPILLTTDDANTNQATFLFLADGGASDHVADYERCFEIFDGHDDEVVAAARARWKTYKEADHTLTYWQQTERGWENTASG